MAILPKSKYLLVSKIKIEYFRCSGHTYGRGKHSFGIEDLSIVVPFITIMLFVIKVAIVALVTLKLRKDHRRCIRKLFTEESPKVGEKLCLIFAFNYPLCAYCLILMLVRRKKSRVFDKLCMELWGKS